jgi:putative SOS response-associated peptidase YedK
MPVVLSADACRAWIDPEQQDLLALAALLLPAPAEQWTAVPVGTGVNHVSNDDASLIVPA